MTAKHIQAKALADSLLSEYGLSGMFKFAFDRAKRRQGSCHHPWLNRPGLITLSVFYVQQNPLEMVRGTLLHEIAHALVGPRHGHDSVWRRKCLEIGGDGRRCGQGDMPKGKWRATCAECEKEYSRFKRPQVTGYHCGKCGPRKGQLTWTSTPSSIPG